MRSEQTCDVAIVGGGMVGAALAAALERHGGAGGPRVTLLESADLTGAGAPAQPGFDARSTALSHGSRLCLEDLGLWEAMAPLACPIERIHVSDRGRFGAVRLDSREQGVEALGHVLENPAIGAALNQALAAARSVQIRDRTQVASLFPIPQGMRLNLERDGAAQSLEARLVVLAEGGRSGLCGQLGIERETRPYRQSAVIANVAFEAPHGNTAWERFTGEGPLALLPLPEREGENRAALIWTRGTEEAEALLALEDEAFLARLQQAFGNRLGRFLRVGRRQVYPLSLVSALEECRRGLVLLGNSAQSLHPVAGQGFNLALRNTMALARQILAAHRYGECPGDPRHLQAYAQATRADREGTVAFSDYMTRLFSSGRPDLVWARKFGLFSIDLLPPLKRAFTARAMGLGEAMIRLEDRDAGGKTF